MPSYFYHLTFELYPTPKPTEHRRPEAPSSPKPPIWLPPRGTNIFGNLPTHPSLDKNPPALAPCPSSKPNPQTHRKDTAAGPKATPSVIDCGASSRRPAGEADKAETVPDRTWRERARSLAHPPPSAAIRPQTAVRDWRFGQVSIQSVDLASPPEQHARTQRGTMAGGEAPAAAEAAENPNAAAFAALELGPTLGGDGMSTRAECVSLPAKNTEVGWGVVHFYRGEEMGPLPDLSAASAALTSTADTGGTQGGSPEAGPKEDDGCTTLCIPAVPSYIPPAEFLGFVGERWRTGVTHFRMVMTARMSRYLVLIKFRDCQRAREWQREFNGKVFNSMVPEICHVVFVKSITFATPTQHQASASDMHQRPSYGLKPFPPPTPNLIELPTCPVCLERMDDTNGLMTIPCQHVFHCECLQGWSGSGCPVCRYTGPPHNDASSLSAGAGAGAGAGVGGGKDAFGSAVSNLCAMCDCPEDLWICLICGHVGCGRYKGGHAKEHWKDTAHCFALEIETQHVWDYAGDTWVHRLIRAKGDGKVVELPSHKDGPGGGGGGAGDDVVAKTKVEAVGLEYTHLLTSQLESQRVYFEEKIAQAADKAHTAAHAAESAASRATAAAEKLQMLEARYEELRGDVVPQLERDLARERKRADKAQELARRLGRELQEERGMARGLAERVAHLEKEAEAHGVAMAGLEALREENADLAMFISGQKTLMEMERVGELEAGELEGSSASAPEKTGRKKGRKK